MARRRSLFARLLNRTRRLVLREKVDLAKVVSQLADESGPGPAAVVRLLRRVLNTGLRKHSRLDTPYLRVFADALHQRLRGLPDAADRELRFAQLTRDQAAAALWSPRWLSIYDTCFSSGLLRCLPEIRRQAIASAIDEYERRPTSMSAADRAFRAALDARDMDLAGSILDQLGRTAGSRIPLREYKFFHDVQVEPRFQERAVTDPTSPALPSDAAFQQLVQGKSVAVVGPAPTGEMTGADIDAHNLVVRINYRGTESLGDPTEFGHRTDISYYNGEDSESIAAEPDQTFLEEVAFCVFKTIPHGFQEALVRQRRGRILVQPSLIFNGAPLQGMNVVYDLLRFHPSVLTLYKATFFVSDDAYYDGFRKPPRSAESSQRQRTLDRLRSFAVHDLVSQVNFTRNLRDSGAIRADDACSRVLDMTVGEFTAVLSKLYTW